MSLSTVAHSINNVIVKEAANSGLTVCQLSAEILKQQLQSADCEKCHVHWLELYALLEETLMKESE